MRVFMGMEGGGGVGGGWAGVGVESRSSNAVSPFISEYEAPRTAARAFPGSCCVFAHPADFLIRRQNGSDMFIFRKFADTLLQIRASCT